MSVTLSDEDRDETAGAIVIRSALYSGAMLAEETCPPSLDAGSYALNTLLAAAAVMVARRALGNRDRLTRLVAEAQAFLEARAEDAQIRAKSGRRP